MEVDPFSWYLQNKRRYEASTQ